MAVKNKFVGPLYLGADEYRRLEAAGLSQERDPLQHARWLIKQALQHPTTTGPERSPEGCPAQPTAPEAVGAA